MNTTKASGVSTGGKGVVQAGSDGPGEGGVGVSGPGGASGARGGVPENFGPKEGLYAEHALAAELGVAQEEFRKKRAIMVEGAEWRMEGNTVVYNRQGLEVLLVFLGLAKKTAGGVELVPGLDLAVIERNARYVPATAPKSAPGVPAVVSGFPLNKRLARARLESGREVYVRKPRDAEWHVGEALLIAPAGDNPQAVYEVTKAK